jgi:hypothetical protein
VAVFTETIKLEDQVSPAAKAAANESRVLGSAMVSVQNQMVKAAAIGGTMSAAYLKLSQKASQLETAMGKVDKGLLQEVEDAKKLDAALAKAAAGKAKLGSASNKTAKTLPNLTQEMLRSQGAAQSLAQSNAIAADSGAGLQAELAELTGGLSIVAEVAAGVAGAFGLLIFAGVKLALSANEAKQKMTTLFDSLGEGKITGKETIAMLDELGEQIGQTREQLAPLTKGFLTMGITGTEELKSLTLAAASAGALAEGGAEKFTKFFGVVNAAAQTGEKLKIPFKKLETQLQGVGLNIGDLAKQMGISEAALTKGLKAGTIDAKKFGDALTEAATSKGAGPLANAGKQLGQSWEKFKTDLVELFEDIDVGPFLSELKSVFGIFSKGSPVGKQLKGGIGDFFKQVFSILTKLVPMAKHFFIDMAIYALKAYIAAKPILKWLLDLRNNETVMTALVGAMKTLGVVLLVVGAAIAFVVALVVGAWAAATLLIVGVYALIGSFNELTQGAGKALADWLKTIPGVANDFISGLVNGIKAGAAAVIAAVTGVVGGAIDAAKKKLGIASPSKVMMQIGDHTATGMAEGIEAANDNVHGAASGLASAAVKGAQAPAPASGGSDKGGGTVVNINVQVDGAGKSAQEITDEMIAQSFERYALVAGL